MALRLIEVIIPENRREEVSELLKEQPVLDSWDERISNERIHVKLLIDQGNCEAVLDLLGQRFNSLEGFRAMLLNVEAAIPRKEELELPDDSQLIVEPEQKPKSRISREELYTDIVDSTRLSWVYIVTVILSSIVAAIGILNDSIAIVIGAMVIAPLLGPNVALSLATTLGDVSLARNAVKTNLAGLATAFVCSVALGFIVSSNPDVSVVAAKTEVRLDMVVLALASGSAGALAFTTGLSTILIGVMVAVALLPPLVTFGLLLGAGYWSPALTALQLFLINIICINLAGVVTFLIQGIRPATWWEAARAKRATLTAIAFWFLVLLLLVVVILFWQEWFGAL